MTHSAQVLWYHGEQLFVSKVWHSSLWQENVILSLAFSALSFLSALSKVTQHSTSSSFSFLLLSPPTAVLQSRLHTPACQGSCWQGKHATSLQKGPHRGASDSSVKPLKHIWSRKRWSKCRETKSLLVISLVFVSLSLSFFAFVVKVNVSGQPDHIVGLSKLAS